MHRWFYYPTYMNGDAECMGQLCQTHWKEWKAAPNKGMINAGHYRKFVEERGGTVEEEIKRIT